jgi:hypothetical protein
MLTVKNLPETNGKSGRYEIRVDGRKLGTFTSKQLAAGLNIASSTADAWQPGGPWNAQANALVALTDARHQLATSGVLARAYVPNEPLVKLLQDRSRQTDDRLIEMQRELARPLPYRFVIEPAEPETKAK